ncbi:MAG: hypothetical protein ACRCXB_23545 [Aeromonadaceae bacterium]
MPDLIHILLALVVILSLVVAVIYVKVRILTDGHFLTEQRLTGHINKMGDAINGHHRRLAAASGSVGHLDERLRRVEVLAFAPAETILDLTTPLHDNVPVGKSISEDMIDRLTALQREFEQDGAIFSYQLRYQPNK